MFGFDFEVLSFGSLCRKNIQGFFPLPREIIRFYQLFGNSGLSQVYLIQVQVLNEKVVHHMNFPGFCSYCHNFFK